MSKRKTHSSPQAGKTNTSTQRFSHLNQNYTRNRTEKKSSRSHLLHWKPHLPRRINIWPRWTGDKYPPYLYRPETIFGTTNTTKRTPKFNLTRTKNTSMDYDTMFIKLRLKSNSASRTQPICRKHNEIFSRRKQKHTAIHTWKTI